MGKISISELKLFKACRRAWYFRYIEELVPIDKLEALQIGSNYHEKLETFYKTGELDTSDLSKESAMATAYCKYIAPNFPVRSVEDWSRYDLGNDNYLIGRTDGISDDDTLVEHKTTSGEITEEYEYNLQWDEQILAYMLMTGARKIWYTVCRKPTIRQKKDETEEEFFNRMVEWYDDDTEHKIRLIEVFRTDEEVEAFRQHLVKMVDIVNKSKQDIDSLYRNCAYCTAWGRRCEYSSICLNYKHGEEYASFTRKENTYGL